MNVVISQTYEEVAETLKHYAETGEVSLSGTVYESKAIRSITLNADSILYDLEDDARLALEQAQALIKQQAASLTEQSEEVANYKEQLEALQEKLDSVTSQLTAAQESLTSMQSLVEKYKAIASKIGLASDED